MDDLIFTDSKMNELGVIHTYDLDLDIAGDKSFELTLPDNLLSVGGFWYVIGTEYGGRIDGFKSNTSDNKITYFGRSWRGILSSKVIESKSIKPITYSGSVQDGINNILKEYEFDNLFYCEPAFVDESVSSLVNYTFDFMVDIYTGIIKMADSINFKLKFEMGNDRFIHITPMLRQDYTDYLNYCEDNGLDFEVEVADDRPNHYICFSVNDDGSFYIIHIFTNEFGGILPYKKVQDPIKDDDYILDQSSKLFTHIDEVVEVIDVGSSSTVANYELLKSQPSDWSTNYGSYYRGVKNEESDELSYEEITAVEIPVYDLLTSSSAPGDWAYNYASYYTFSGFDEHGNPTFSPVSADSIVTGYLQQKTQPGDWKYSYSYYYYQFETGTGIEYRAYSAESVEKLTLMTRMPSDWTTNYKNYIKKNETVVNPPKVTKNVKKNISSAVKQNVQNLAKSVKAKKVKPAKKKKGKK